MSPRIPQPNGPIDTSRHHHRAAVDRAKRHGGDPARRRWLTGVPEDKKAELIPAGWFDQWADATWATDPDGAKMNPPVIRAPNGVVQDGADLFGADKPYTIRPRSPCRRCWWEQNGIVMRRPVCGRRYFRSW